MIGEDSIESFNNRLNVDLNSLKSLTPSQKDRVRHYGSQAESLLKNKDFAMFIHHYKFQLVDDLSGIRGHSPEDDKHRVAISCQLLGIDEFVNSLKKAVYYKDRVGNNEMPNT